MPAPAASTPRRNAEYVRALVGSAPIAEAPATAVVESEAVAAPPEQTTAAAAARGSWNAHLAQLLHSMCLVSLVEKAQLGAMPVFVDSAGARRGTSAAARPSPSPLSASVAAPAMHSVAIEPRWLDAVTRYCHFTFTLDDVARVAMVFPEHVQVRWTLDASSNFDKPDAAGDSADTDLGASVTSSTTSTTVGLQQQQHGRPKSATGGVLRGRLYLPANHVVSAAEAEAHLERALRQKGSPAAQHAWKELVNHHNAYAAYLDAVERATDARDAAAAATTPAGDSTPDVNPHEPPHHRGNHRPDGNGTTAAAPSASEQELLSQLSAELKASLSPSMLRSLLTQMRRDAAQTERHALQQAAAKQLRERLLSAYEHVRALLGGKQASGRSAAALLAAMRDESRFDDALDSVALLSSLLEISASGLTATLLEEAPVAPPPPAPSPSPGTHHTARRKRQRGAAQEVPQESPAVPQPTEPVLKPVTDLRHLSEAQLQLVRVQLDRSTGSVKGVIDATRGTG